MITSTHNRGPIFIDAHPDDKLTYVQWDIDDYLSGIQALKPEQVGFYSIILCLLYKQMGQLKDNDKFIAGHCKCDVRYYQKLRQTLLDSGKIYEADGYLYNNRAMAEIAKFCETMRKRREAAKLREESKRETRQKDAVIAGDAEPTITDEAHQNSATRAPRAPDARATRAPRAPDAHASRTEKHEKHNTINDTPTRAVAELSIYKEEEKKRYSKKEETTHTRVALPPSARVTNDLVGGGGVVLPNLPPVERVTTPPEPEGPREGEIELGDGVFESKIEIRHRSFAISIEALLMQLVTANIGLSAHDSRKVARDSAVAHALQWATELRNGKLSRDVLPTHIVNFIRGAVVKQRAVQNKATLGVSSKQPSYMSRY